MAGSEPGAQQLRAGGLGEQAFAVARIEQLVEFRGELAVVFVALRLGELRKFSGGANAMCLQPCVAPAPPVRRDAYGHRIRKPRGDEVGRAPLPPMRELPALDMHLGVRLERREGHAARV
ncbi:MAG: hypothetical protein ABMA01_05410 [Chthoniobacteraceae bacterium]